MDPLDDTRIHPESYELAKNLAETAYTEHQEANHEEVEEEILEMAVEHVKDNPVLLTNVDVQKYSDMVEERDGISKFYTLQDIVNELLHGYKEWRYPYRPPSEEELFTLMTGETDETIGLGRLVTVRVKEITPRGIKCDVGNGLPGFIQKEDFSDEIDPDQDLDLRELVPVGSMITCRIKNIRKSIMVEDIKGDTKPPRYYSADLTCKGAIMRTDDWGKIRLKEKYFSQEALNSHNEKEKAKKAKDDAKRKSFKPRMIVHPQFQNVSMTDAIEVLSSLYSIVISFHEVISSAYPISFTGYAGVGTEGRRGNNHPSK
jgi:transcription elongation factor SPT6